MIPIAAKWKWTKRALVGNSDTVEASDEADGDAEKIFFSSDGEEIEKLLEDANDEHKSLKG